MTFLMATLPVWIEKKVILVSGSDDEGRSNLGELCSAYLPLFKIMRRGRAKGKKIPMTNQDDMGSGEEEKIPAQKRRGRPQKPLKDDIDEDEVQKIEDEDSEDTARLTDKGMKSKTAAQNGKKRKRNAQVKEKVDSVTEENGIKTRSSMEESNKSNGFRQNGSRRKNKPRRAAEAVVECN